MEMNMDQEVEMRYPINKDQSYSNSQRTLRKQARERNFIGELVHRGQRLQFGGGDLIHIIGEVTRGEIITALQDSGIVKNPDSRWGKFKVWRNIRRVHQVDYWRGYSFKPVSGKPETYTVDMDDVSGLPGWQQT